MTSRISLWAMAVMLLASPSGHAAPCGRWAATLISESGLEATLDMRLRKCGVSSVPSHVPPACRGRYRCRGDACPFRRGVFQMFPAAKPDGTYGLGPAELRRRRGGPRACFTVPTEPGGPSRYTCYAEDDTVSDHGTLDCTTLVMCGRIGC